MPTLWLDECKEAPCYKMPGGCVRDCTPPSPSRTGESGWGVLTGREKDRSRWVTQMERAWQTGARAEPGAGSLRCNWGGGLI
jgi:hypothetical protein